MPYSRRTVAVGQFAPRDDRPPLPSRSRPDRVQGRLSVQASQARRSLRALAPVAFRVAVRFSLLNQLWKDRQRARRRERTAAHLRPLLRQGVVTARNRLGCRAVSRSRSQRYSIVTMFRCRQISFSSFGQTVTLTSPRWALRSSSMVVRDWPMPPPMLSGISSLRIAW